MPAFLKSPKFIIGSLIVLWVAFVIYANFQLAPIEITLIPFAASLQFSVSAVLIAAALFGAAATLVIQFLWRRRSSKKASAPVEASSRTVA